MSPDRRYIYGIIQRPRARRFDLPGVEDAEVYAIQHQELAAVVSDTELEEIDPTRKNVRAHTAVQDGLLRDYTLLPMGFGMIAAANGDVSRLLQDNYSGLLREMGRLEGKVEVGLKVFWEQEAMVKELQSGNDELARLKARIEKASSSVEAQSLLIEAGRLVEHTALKWKTKYADEVYALLKGLCVDSRLNRPLGIKNILSASFLLEKAKEDEFRKEVYRLDLQYQGKVSFKYVGPLAPYSFVDLRLETSS